MFYGYVIVNNFDISISYKSQWADIQKLSIKPFIVKKFKTENEYKNWYKIVKNKFFSLEDKKQVKDMIFFDSGTARIMLEVRIADHNGISLLSDIIDDTFLNDKYNLALDNRVFTNNYGELLACLLATRLAIKQDKKVVCGDSVLVIFYCLEKDYKCTNVDQPLLEEMRKTYKHFSHIGGKIKYISRDLNSADLRFKI